MEEKTSEIKIEELKDAELVKMAGSSTLGTNSGLKAQLAQAELLRRNTTALTQASKSSDRYALNVLVLTVFLFAIAMTQFMLDILSLDGKWSRLFYGLIIAVGIVYAVGREFRNDSK